jgi:NAD(P)-dependent dehydrogenase (short-subunit alcohol dehydrogenase family)
MHDMSAALPSDSQADRVNESTTHHQNRRLDEVARHPGDDRVDRLLARIGTAAALMTSATRSSSARRWDLRGRTVVTGGSRGLGLSIAHCRSGRAGRLCGRDEAAWIARGATSSVARDRPRCDMRVKNDVDLLVKEVSARLGPIDALVNNAGLITVGPVEAMDVRDFADAMDTNFWGPLHAIRAVLPEMRRRRTGRIVNIASIGGMIAMPHVLPYSASKFALVGLSEGLRAELARDGILVTTICPGLMRTGSSRHAFFKGRPRAEHAWFSISASLPGLSMDVEHAAREIIEALCAGEAGRVLSLPAKLGALAHGLSPGFTAEVLGLVNRCLPSPQVNEGDVRLKGEDSVSALSPSWLTRLGDRAAKRNNQTA